MSERERDIQYLNRVLRQLWPSATDILRSEVTHAVFEEAEEKFWRLSRARTRLDLSADPAFFADGPDGLRLRIPASGAHTFKTRVYLVPGVPWWLSPRISAEVALALEVKISPGAEPQTGLDISVEGSTFGNVADIVADWKGEVRDMLAGEDINEELGYFATARYAREAVPDIPDPELVYPDRELLDGGVNLVLVPDGFPSNGLDRFDGIVERVVERLRSPDEKPYNEPFHSFKTALHVWKIKPEQSADGDHVVAGYTDPRNQYRAALANLARLAAIRRKAESVGSGRTVLVFVADHENSRFDHPDHNRPPSAMAMGNLILQMTQDWRPDTDPDDPHRADASLLLHELCHTGLARLGDEYVQGSRKDDEYLGQPLGVPNLTADEDLAKWQRWLDAPSELPSWDEHPVTGEEGGGYFGRGIWRPADDCAMKSSTAAVPFCAVCREAMTNGIWDALPDGLFLFQVSYPSGETVFIEVEPDDDMSEQITVPVGGSTDLRVTLIAGTLPEPWDLRASFEGDGDLGIQRDHRDAPGWPGPPRTAWSFPATPGDRLVVRIASRCPFTPWDRLPGYTVELHCVPDREEVEPPSTPTDLSARQTSTNPPGTHQPVRLSASAADPNGQDLRLQFEVTRSEQQFIGRVHARSDWLSQPANNPRVTAEANHRVSMEGAYKVRARAENRSGRRSGWSDPVSLPVRPRESAGGGDGNGDGPIHTP